MTTQHTPGPWEWDSAVWDYDPNQDAPWLVTEALGDRVLSGMIQCNGEANARLISAAPDLLEALRESQIALGLMLSYHGQGQQDYADVAQVRAQDAYDLNSAAIAKATGEQA